MRTKQIYMGAGTDTEEEIIFLESQLEYALVAISGMQQLANDEDPQVKKDKKLIKNIVRDIAIALTGEDIKFIKTAVVA